MDDTEEPGQVNNDTPEPSAKESRADHQTRWQYYKNGTWLLDLVEKSFKNYWELFNDEYFRAKYPHLTEDQIARRMIAVACKQAAALGVGTGAAMSANEIIAIATGAEGGVGLPANLAIAATAFCGEAAGLARIWLKLIVELGRLYGVELNPDDPEDIWTILTYAMGGQAAMLAGNLGVQVGKHGTKILIRRVIRKETLKALQNIGRTIGIKILQRTIIKYTVPGISILIGGSWNYVSTRSVGKIAQKQFKACAELSPEPPPAAAAVALA